MVEAGPPSVATGTVEGVVEVLSRALAASVVPYQVPAHERGRVSGVLAAAGVKSMAAFNRSAVKASIHERDDRYDVLRGFPSGGGWIEKVIQRFSRETPFEEVARAVLSLLQDRDMVMPKRTPEE
jgi:hypothetical protein